MHLVVVGIYGLQVCIPKRPVPENPTVRIALGFEVGIVQINGLMSEVLVFRGEKLLAAVLRDNCLHNHPLGLWRLWVLEEVVDLSIVWLLARTALLW